MRRGPSRIGPTGTSRRREHRAPAGTLADRLRSARPLTKLGAASVVGLGLYVVLSVGIGATVRSGAIDGRVDLGVGKGPGGGGALTGGGGGAGKKEWGLRRTPRKLNMIGFESEGGEGGEWKTCRAYEETGLGPHKKVGQAGHDPFLRQVKPTVGAKWELAMSEDQDAEWLGLHQWDDTYTHGSKEADRRVKELGYCRVHMPSVPRTGSTWFRAMFEAATGQPSFSMWQEGGTFKEKYKAFSSDDPCGSSLDHMEGRLNSKKIFPCRDMKPPNATSPILYKSHTPFFPSYNKPSLMPSQTCMLLLLVRNPIDNQDAWTRYMAGKGESLREYLPVWQGHVSHWIAAAGDIPIYVFRYEDMLYRAEDVLRRILQTLPGGWVWSEESIAKAMRMYGPQRPFESKCGSGLKKCSVAEVNMVREHYGSYMRHLGYRFIKK